VFGFMIADDFEQACRKSSAIMKEPKPGGHCLAGG
jgi:hypothetical protein